MTVDANTPIRYRATCVHCADQVDRRHADTYQLIHGWARIGNNGNSVSLAKRDDQWACGECISKLKAGIPVGQRTLFNFDAP